jgi:hypothetical protein
MTFARVKGRPSPAQRRWLQLMAQHGWWHARSLRPATRRKLVDLGYAVISCGSCDTPLSGDAATDVLGCHRITITDRGRKYLSNWNRAYGTGARVEAA